MRQISITLQVAPMYRHTITSVFVIFLITLATPSHAFFGKSFKPMTEMIKQMGKVADNMVSQSGKTARKMVETNGKIFASMVKLTSTLSDDIGTMANRILEMADKIGEMADRIVKTEAMMADLARDLAGKGEEKNSESNIQIIQALERIETQLGNVTNTIFLTTQQDFASKEIPPAIELSQKSDKYLLYISRSAVFAEGRTVISLIQLDDFQAAWVKSIDTFSPSSDTPLNLFLAVKTIDDDNVVSALSNSIRITVE
jgi:hypothetical protein